MEKQHINAASTDSTDMQHEHEALVKGVVSSIRAVPVNK
jgi:hypothetical protein